MKGMNHVTRDEKLQQIAEAFDFPLGEAIKVGGRYAPVVISGDTVYVAGQIPRVVDQVHYIGAAGAEISLEDARRAAGISALRGLVLAQHACGSLNAISAVPRIGVFVRSAPDFTLQSEVADGASDVLYSVLGEVGVHVRTSVGVSQLPKGAVVEVEFVFKREV